MIEAGEFVDFNVLVAGLFQSFTDRWEILGGDHLLIECAVDGEHGAGYFAQRNGWIIGEEEAEPGRGDLFDLSADLGLGNFASQLFF